MKNTILLFLLSCQVFAFAQRGDYKPDKPTPSISNGKGTNSQKPAVKPKPEVTADKNTVTLNILPAMAPCPGNPTQQCYQIKKSGSDAIEYVDDIEKLPSYEFGYTYSIQAKQKEKEVYIEGQSPYKYVWVKTNSKKEGVLNYIDNSSQNNTTSNDIKTVTENGKSVGVSSINTSSAIDGIWYLRKMKEAEGKSIVTDDNVMWIDINTFKDYLSGFGACNKFEATLRSDLNTKFTVSKITPTYFSCGNEIVEKLFFSLLEQTNKFEIKNGNLILSNQWNFLLGFTKDKDNKEDIPVTYTPDKIIQNNQQTFATDGNLKDKTVSDLPIQYKHTEYTEVTTTQKNDEAPKTTIVQSSVLPTNTNISDKDKQIADLQKQLDDIKKSKEEEQKQQLIKQQQEVQEKEKAAAALKQQQEELEKEKKIEELKKQLDELNNKKPIDKPNNTNVNNTNVANSKQIQNINKQNAYIGYYLNNNQVILPQETAEIHLKNNNFTFVISDLKSNTVFKENKEIQLYAKYDGFDPAEDILVCKLSNKNNKRESSVLDINEVSNTVDISFGYKKNTDKTYAILFPTPLNKGNYALLFKSALKNIKDMTKVDIFTFSVD